MFLKKFLFINGIFMFLLFCTNAENSFAQKNMNDIINIKTKKYKSTDYSIDKLKKSHRISKQWVRTYRQTYVARRNSHKRYVRQLKGWECPSYKTFVYLRKKKPF
jgi:hypothetical protein